MVKEDKEEVSREKLENIECKIFYNKIWVQKEYNSLSPEARVLLNTWVDRVFWGLYPHMDGKELDPNDPEHRIYVEKWEHIRSTNLIKRKEHWEKLVPD